MKKITISWNLIGSFNTLFLKTLWGIILVIVSWTCYHDKTGSWDYKHPPKINTNKYKAVHLALIYGNLQQTLDSHNQLSTVKFATGLTPFGWREVEFKINPAKVLQIIGIFFLTNKLFQNFFADL